MIQYGQYGLPALPKPLNFNTGPAGTDASSGAGYAPRPPAPPTGIGAYTSAILGDPVFKALQAQVTAANQAAQGTTSAGFGNDLAQYGEIPDLQKTAQALGLNPSSPLYQMLMQAANNPDTQNAAQQLNASGLSTTAHQQTANQQALANFLGTQNANNNGYQSGATGVGVGQQEQANSLAQAQNYQTLLGHLTDLASAYNSQYQAGQGQLTQGLQNAATREIGLGSPLATKAVSSIIPSLNIGGK